MLQSIDQLFEQFRALKVGVIGDIMLDSYMWGHVDRISPEAPVPVVLLDRKEYRLGGAANVALNVRSLGAPVSLFSVVGSDEEGERLINMLREQSIQTNGLIQSSNRITTNKTRIISRNQQMMRLDSETTRELNEADTNYLLTAIEEYITKEKPGVVILEDYNKGVLTGSVIEHVIALCKKHRVITAVDPKRKNFFAYKGVDIFKPNLKEAKDALNLIGDQPLSELMPTVHTQLNEELNHRVSFITLSEKGVFYQQGDDRAIIPSHVRNISDVSGAGDTVIAVAALVYALTGDAQLMASISNIAGGLVCEEVGTVPVNSERLKQECLSLLT
ncbi:MAG: bifunctional heptose 7-phosphate kinase/heptose 1-phosphate adenyltransferase [Lacibacter sp.]